jgi:hypothetical protein
MEDVKKELMELQDSEVYLAWKDNHPDAYLTHAFCMYESKGQVDWQFGFYHKDTDKITTFVMEDMIKKMPESEVLKRDDMLNPVDMTKVDIDLMTALNVARTLQEEKYKGQSPLKIIVLLQNLREGLVWNITYLTQGFKTLNIKISAETGDVVDSSLKSLISGTL